MARVMSPEKQQAVIPVDPANQVDSQASFKIFQSEKIASWDAC